jgi:hypothetical protein
LTNLKFEIRYDTIRDEKKQLRLALTIELCVFTTTYVGVKSANGRGVKVYSLDKLFFVKKLACVVFGWSWQYRAKGP